MRGKYKVGSKFWLGGQKLQEIKLTYFPSRFLFTCKLNSSSKLVETLVFCNLSSYRPGYVCNGVATLNWNAFNGHRTDRFAWIGLKFGVQVAPIRPLICQSFCPNTNVAHRLRLWPWTNLATEQSVQYEFGCLSVIETSTNAAACRLLRPV